MAAGWPTRTAIKELEELVDAHDDLIKKHFKQTWKRRIFYAVQFVAPAILAAATANPFVGLASGGALKLVEARFPSITADPGAPRTVRGRPLTRRSTSCFTTPTAHRARTRGGASQCQARKSMRPARAGGPYGS